MARANTADPPSSPWSSSGFPPKIAAAVLRRLPSHADRVRFAAVCRPWRAAAARHPRPPLPWLALADGTLYSFPSSAALRFNPAAAGYHGSCDDWLLFSGDGEDGYLLANPFTGATARLPPLSRVRFAVGDGGAALAWRGMADDRRAPRGTTVRKLAMCPGGRGLVAAMVGDGRVGKIAMCKIAGEGSSSSSSSWVMSGHDAWRGIADITFYDGKVYAVDDAGELLAMPTGVDARTGEPSVAWARCVVKASDHHGAPSSRRRRRKQPPPPSMRYLFVHGGRLMMVHRTAVGNGGATAKFAVFMADLAASRWSEVASVGGDTALFVGRWRTLARRVSMYGMPGNMIHFLDDDRCFSRGCPGSFGSYDMGDGKTYSLLPPPTPPEFFNSGGSDTPATWLFPRDREQEVSRWCDLPCDVIGLVLRHLRCREDRLSLSEVCHDWCVSARQHLRRRPRPRTLLAAAAPPPPAATAYLVLPNGRLFRFPELKSRLPDKKLAGFAGFTAAGAACDDGVLFHHDGGGLLRLVSPFTGKTTLLPSFHGIRAHGWRVKVVNDDPTAAWAAARWRRRCHDDKAAMAVRKLVVCPDGGVAGAGGGGFVYAAAILGGEHLGKVALCSPETFSWSHSAGDRWRRYDDLALVGGRLYALTGGEDLLAMDVGFDGGTGGEPFVSRVERVVEGDRHAPVAGTVRYLVAGGSGGGELLMVRRRLPYAGDGEDARSRFAVFRADLAAARWEPVSRLGRGGAGGEALFVGRLCSRAVRGRRYLPGGQIFFLPDECPAKWVPRRRPGHHAAVYNMLDGKVTDLLPRQRQDEEGPWQATWLFSTEIHC
ncbi:unnamed protein product [Urochloa humidicola]